jgi:hypothetical protein
MKLLTPAAEPRDMAPARIECWWDSQSQIYITQLLTAEGDQIDARLDGHVSDAAYSVQAFHRECGRRINMHLSDKVARAVRQAGWKLQAMGRSPQAGKVYARVEG